jgi:hypothetical protein
VRPPLTNDFIRKLILDLIGALMQKERAEGSLEGAMSTCFFAAVSAVTDNALDEIRRRSKDERSIITKFVDRCFPSTSADVRIDGTDWHPLHFVGIVGELE